MQTKILLRQQMLQRRLAVTEADQAKSAAAFTEAFLAHFNAVPRCVAGYMPMRGELDVIPLLTHLHEAGWECALPVMNPGEKCLQFCRWQPQDVLEAGPYGVLQPRLQSEFAEIMQPEVILVPLLAYDDSGNRLGYGGGYYDATLPHYPQAVSVGCAYRWQCVAEGLPVETQDIRLQQIISVV